VRAHRAACIIVCLLASCLVAQGATASATALAGIDPAMFTTRSAFELAGNSFVSATQASWFHYYGIDGDGVTVAVIDTGIEPVAGLDGALVHQENLSAGPATGDQYGHGTFVAGIIHQVAPQARLVSVKLSGADGSVDVTQVLAALQWVVANRAKYGIDVVNLSFGNDSRQSANTSPLNYAVQKAWDAGIVVVASAGNLGSDGVTKPGDDPVIITVGASDDAGTVTLGDDAVAPFSSWGTTVDGVAKPDLVAAGTRIVSLRVPGSTIDATYPEARVGADLFRGSGTSFSAPIIAGAAALALEVAPDVTPDQMKYGLRVAAAEIHGGLAAQGEGTLLAGLAVWHLNDLKPGRGGRRSSGRGRLQDARGSAVVDVAASDGGYVRVNGNTTEALAPYDDAEYLSDESWDASRWGATQWGASRWGASRWGASRWGASEWWASRWG
jgi:serine protease AprX